MAAKANDVRRRVDREHSVQRNTQLRGTRVGEHGRLRVAARPAAHAAIETPDAGRAEIARRGSGESSRTVRAQGCGLGVSEKACPILASYNGRYENLPGRGR